MSGDDQTPPPGDDARTVFSPFTGLVTPEPAQPVPLPAPPAQFTAPTHTPPAESRRIQIGDVLNHIFEVRRFIARGGMGEVFEGINVNSEERVAIKVILPHLAADPSVQAMFRKEARTLTRLNHPALVQYRVLAQEPQLGAFYIVTEYVEGENLSDLLKDLDPSQADLRMLAKRLAEGLAAAHALGAIHRDISPDNIMLERGRLDHAKIIDFGIAKDLDASTGTIIGDGFAGKLNYVAPEQLGDFNREVGPWTDVYSLALTILAVAGKQNVNMGATLVEAVDKRRAGPDLSMAPAELRPVLEKMLRPNPADRARSMEEVIQLLADPSHAVRGLAEFAPSIPNAGDTSPIEKRRRFQQVALPEWSKKPAVIGAAVGAVVLLSVLGLTISHFTHGGTKPAPIQAPNPAAAPPPADLAAAAREAVGSGLQSVPCTWLDLVNAEANGNSVSLSFRGVAGKPAEAQRVISQLLTAKGLQPGSIDFGDVSPIEASECGPLEAFRKIRAVGAEHISVPQRSFEMGKLGPEAGEFAGQVGAKAILNVNLNGITDDVALVGLEPSGAMTEFVTGKRDITDATDTMEIDKPQPGVYRITLNTSHAGWSGIMLLTGKGPFDSGLLSGKGGSHGGDWPDKFLKVSQQRGWKSEMVWYRTVDQVAN